MYTCPECANDVDDHAVFCDYCGLRLTPESVEAEVSAEALSSTLNADQNNSGSVLSSAGDIQPGTCSACGFANIPGEMFCQNCGVQLAPVASLPPPMPMPVAASSSVNRKDSAVAQDVCPTCGHQNLSGETFCQNCGIQLASPDNESAPVVSPPLDSPSVVSPLEVSPPVDTIPGECSSCGFTNTSGNAFCENCGLHLIPDIPEAEKPINVQPQHYDCSVCSYCGHPRSSGVQYCDSCGMEFGLHEPAFIEVIPQAPNPVEQPAVEPDAVEQPAVERPVIEQPLDPISQDGMCPNCAYPSPPGAEFCENCGLLFPLKEPDPAASASAIPLEEPVQAVSASETRVESQSESASTNISGKLVMKKTGVEIGLPSGKSELLLGRSDPLQGVFPDVDFEAYGGDDHGVSRSHAKLSISGPQLYIEDLNSTNFTFINQQRLDPLQLYALSAGDEIRLGLLLLEYRA